MADGAGKGISIWLMNTSTCSKMMDGGKGNYVSDAMPVCAFCMPVCAASGAGCGFLASSRECQIPCPSMYHVSVSLTIGLSGFLGR
jgi:hypothetical protein